MIGHRSIPPNIESRLLRPECGKEEGSYPISAVDATLMMAAPIFMGPNKWSLPRFPHFYLCVVGGAD